MPSGIQAPDEPAEADEPAPVPPATLTRTRPAGGLVYNPLVQVRSQTQMHVCGRREVPGTVPWGFWGGLLVAMVAVFLITGSRSIFYIWDILWALVALTVGLVMFRYGRRSSLQQEVLCEVDLAREMLVWPAQRDQDASSIDATGRPGDAELVLSFEDVGELVFGMIDYPLSTRQNDVRVQAFTLLVRDDNERLIPIIEATPNKKEAHDIAKLLAGQLQLGISYVGKGFQ